MDRLRSYPYWPRMIGLTGPVIAIGLTLTGDHLGSPTLWRLQLVFYEGQGHPTRTPDKIIKVEIRDFVP